MPRLSKWTNEHCADSRSLRSFPFREAGHILPASVCQHTCSTLHDVRGRSRKELPHTWLRRAPAPHARPAAPTRSARRVGRGRRSHVADFPDPMSNGGALAAPDALLSAISRSCPSSRRSRPAWPEASSAAHAPRLRASCAGACSRCGTYRVRFRPPPTRSRSLGRLG